MDEAAKNEVHELAREVMSIVLDVAAKRLEQTVCEIHESRIAPLKQALRNCQTLTPSLMDGEAAKDRLRNINSYIYAVLGEGR